MDDDRPDGHDALAVDHERRWIEERVIQAEHRVVNGIGRGHGRLRLASELGELEVTFSARLYQTPTQPECADLIWRTRARQLVAELDRLGTTWSHGESAAVGRKARELSGRKLCPGRVEYVERELAAIQCYRLIPGVADLESEIYMCAFAVTRGSL
jgi:hypothetical protein